MNFEHFRRLLDRGRSAFGHQTTLTKAVALDRFGRFKKRAQTWGAIGWLRFHALHSRLVFWFRPNVHYVYAVLLLILVACNLYYMPKLQQYLSVEIKDSQIEPLRALLLNLGGPLIGATAIVSSLVLFAMQVNVEHMPHGLFRRLSADRRILTSFAAAFALAIGTACLSMVVDKTRLALSVSIATWSILIILFMFLYAYRRALDLVNPSQQLRIVMGDAVGQLKTWARRAERVAPLYKSDEVAKLEAELIAKSDVARATFFQHNPHWTTGAKRSIAHAISFARHYAERGDYEVSGHALHTVLVINSAYVNAKGKTFFAHSGIFENPNATDGFLSDTLEHLRQLSRASVVRVDEQQIEQTLRTLNGLANVYLDIDYGSPTASKTHAKLAAGYLSEAVKSLPPANMPDVLMEGVRLMGATAQAFLVKARPIDMVKQAEDIATIGSIGAVNPNYRVVTLTAVEQLANLTIDLLRVGRGDTRFAMNQLRGNVTLVAELFLATKDSPLVNAHSTYLGPYYSSTSPDALRGRLTALVNAVAAAESTSKDAKTVLNNLVEWSEKLPEAEKSLLLLAIKARSHFTFDELHWIVGVTEILMGASNAPACDERTGAELRKNAIRLLRVLDWIPTDKESIAFIEGYQLSELLGDSTFDAIRRECTDVAEVSFRMMVSWSFKAGKYQTGWGSLAQGLNHAVVIASFHGEPWTSALKSLVSKEVAKPNAPDLNARFRAAEDVREETQSIHRYTYPTSRLQAVLNEADPTVLESIGEEVAALLVPGLELDQRSTTDPENRE